MVAKTCLTRDPLYSDSSDQPPHVTGKIPVPDSVLPALQLEFIYTCAILFTAYLVRGMAGFGSGLIAIPLLSLLHPVQIVVPLVVILDYLGSASQGIRLRHATNWRELMPLAPFTLAGVLVALFLFKALDPVLLTKAMGYFVLVFAIYQLLPGSNRTGSRLWALPTGFLGGLIGTLFGTGGPFYMIYLRLRNLEQVPTVASFATWFMVDGTIRIVGFIAIGLVTFALIPTLLLWIPAALLGLLLGGRVHTGLTKNQFRLFISLLLVFSGYKLITME